MLRLESEQNKAAKGGKMLSAKEPEIPPAVQVELVDLSKQVWLVDLIILKHLQTIIQSYRMHVHLTNFFVPKMSKL